MPLSQSLSQNQGARDYLHVFSWFAYLSITKYSNLWVCTSISYKYSQTCLIQTYIIRIHE